MNMGRLQLSFLALIAMTVLQFFISIFIIHNHIIAILSIIGCLASIFGFFYAGQYTKK